MTETGKEYYKKRDEILDNRLANIESSITTITEYINKQQQTATYTSNFDTEMNILREQNLYNKYQRESKIEWFVNQFMVGFKLWCYAKKPILDNNNQIDFVKTNVVVITNEKLFKEYCQSEYADFMDKEFEIKKYIAEHNFGYKYEFKDGKWIAKKAVV